MPTPQENTSKFRELILYISQKCANDPNFGATKLNKILYFSDFLSFAHYGSAITGAEYQKLPQGPAPRRLLPVRSELERQGALGLQQMPVGSFVQQRTVNLRAPNLSVFSAQEIALVDSVIDAVSEHTATKISDMSHEMVGWKLAEVRETIPYASVFLCEQQPLTEADIKKGLEIATKNGLLATAN